MGILALGIEVFAWGIGPNIPQYGLSKLGQ